MLKWKFGNKATKWKTSELNTTLSNISDLRWFQYDSSFEEQVVTVTVPELGRYEGGHNKALVFFFYFFK